MIERERRYLVARVPDALPAPDGLVQGYLTTSPVSVRVRRIEPAHGHTRRVLTIKGGSGRTRTEIERDLADDEFEALWALATELRIAKRRHRIEIGNGLTAELDLFDAELEGRRLVEVEFDDEETADAFSPPDWFGREVTEDARYTNAALARHGWPDEG